MQAFIDFFTGALNDFAWLYMFLPCVMVGGILLTVRTKAVQFSHFGYAMKNTVGKMFKKTEARKRRRHAASGRDHRSCRHCRPPAI